MNSKKFIPVVLSVLLLMSSAFCVSAEKTATEIAVSLSALNVEVKVTTEASEGRMIAMIKNKENTAWVGLEEAKTFETQENGKNVYTFRFVMQPNSETGVYTVAVGGNVALAEQDFQYVNLNQLVLSYNELAAAEISEIYGLLTSENHAWNYDFSIYKGLTPEIRTLVDAIVAEMECIEGVTLGNIAEKEDLFFAEMDAVMELAQIADANTGNAEWMKLVTQKNTENVPVYDTKYLEKGNQKTVQSYCAAYDFTKLDKEEIQNALDTAQLLAVAEEQGYSALKKAFRYYLEKGTLVLDNQAQAAYDEACEAEKENAFFEQLKLLDNSTVEKMIDNIPEAAEKALEAEEDEDSGSTGGGGGSSGGGGRGGSGGSLGGNRNNPGTTLMDGSAQDTVVKKEEQKETVGFSDLSEAAWAEDAILYLAEKDVLSGRGDGRFCPNDMVTREEFVKIMITAFAFADDTASASFEDVREDRWSYKYIATANKMGLVTGMSETVFAPSGTITREDMAVIAHRAMKLCGIEDGAYVSEFYDAAEIAGYAVPAVNQLAGRGIISGMGNNTFAPKGYVTRAQAAKVVYELLVLNGGVK